MFYTYMHTRNDTSQPFYIGKGSGNRAWVNAGRNKHWKAIAAKHGHTVCILSNWPTEREAFEHETLLIECFREIGADLVNVTNGGDGVSGLVHDISVRSRISASLSGRTRPASVVKKISQSHKGKIVSESTRRLISEANTRRPPASASTRELIAAAHRGAKRLTAARQAMSVAMTGKTKSLDHRISLSRVNGGSPVLCKETGMTFKTIGLAVDWLRANGFPRACHSAISSYLSGQRKTAYGYSWCKLKEESKA